jgi:hypothetical protein
MLKPLGALILVFRMKVPVIKSIQVVFATVDPAGRTLDGGKVFDSNVDPAFGLRTAI